MLAGVMGQIGAKLVLLVNSPNKPKVGGADSRLVRESGGLIYYSGEKHKSLFQNTVL